MARPRSLKNPARLNLMVDAEVKNAIVLLAAEKGLSVGQLITQMIHGQKKRASGHNRGNGDRLSDESVMIASLSRKNPRLPVSA